jgi:hypothetical protein
MIRRTSLLLAASLAIAFGAAEALHATCGGEPHEPRMNMESRGPVVTETPKYVEIIFSKEPESRFFLHGLDRFIAVVQPGKKTVSPSFEQVQEIVFVERDGLLVVEWENVADGGSEKATFRGMDRPAWEKLKKFIAAKELQLRE